MGKSLPSSPRQDEEKNDDETIARSVACTVAALSAACNVTLSPAELKALMENVAAKVIATLSKGDKDPTNKKAITRQAS